MANIAVRLRRGLHLARAFCTTNSRSSSSSSSYANYIPKEPLVCYQSWGFNRLLTPSQYTVARRMFSNSRPLCSPVDTGRSGRNFGGDTEILFEGCDYEHWLITMEFPDPQPTREEKIDTFIKTLAKVVGSEDEAKKRIYALSTTTYTGFQAQITEETSEKMKGLPGVVWVLPDSYIDPVNKEYGGDKYINGVIIPDTRVYNNRPSGRYTDRSRRRDPMPVERRDGMQGDRTDYRPPPMDGRGPMPGGRQDYRPPGVDGRVPMPVDQQYYRPPPVDGRGSMPGDQQYYRPPSMDGRAPMPGDRQDYRPPPVDGRGPMPGNQQYYRPPPMNERGRFPGDQQDYGRGPVLGDRQDYRPPGDGRGPMPGDRQDYGRGPRQEYRAPMNVRGPMPGDRQDYGRGPVSGDWQDYRPPLDGRGSMPENRQDYRPTPDVRGPVPNYRPPMEGRSPIQGEQRDYGSPGEPMQGSSVQTQGKEPVQGGQENFPWPVEGAR